MLTEIFDFIAKILALPFLGVIIGAVFTAYLIPTISKQWRKPKELELKMTVVTKITDSVVRIVSATYLDMFRN